ncbi:MAG: hypothetical protein QXL43_01135, partial [Methanolinea sp.]
ASPAISTGAFRFPPERAARLAVRTVLDFLSRSDRIERVLLVAHGDEAYAVLRDALERAGEEDAGAAARGESRDGPAGDAAAEILARVDGQVRTIELVHGIRFAGREDLVRRVAAACGSPGEADLATAALNTWVALSGERGVVDVPRGVLARLLDGAYLAGKRGEAGRRGVERGE